jgi:hypothetical protein
MPVHETKLYSPTTPSASEASKKAIVLLLNTVGDIMWHYTYRSILHAGVGDVTA